VGSGRKPTTAAAGLSLGGIDADGPTVQAAG